MNNGDCCHCVDFNHFRCNSNDFGYAEIQNDANFNRQYQQDFA